jgi:hypothetical protein
MAKQLVKEHVNRVNSPTWVACNDDAKSRIWREQFINQYGGEFVRTPRNYWLWKEIQVKEPEPTYETLKNQKVFIFTKDGNEVKVHNMTEYCRNNNYSRAALYEVTTGKRKSYKNHIFVKESIEDVTILKK